MDKIGAALPDSLTFDADLDIVGRPVGSATKSRRRRMTRRTGQR
jgi:hypothetical protein